MFCYCQNHSGLDTIWYCVEKLHNTIPIGAIKHYTPTQVCTVATWTDTVWERKCMCLLCVFVESFLGFNCNWDRKQSLLSMQRLNWQDDVFTSFIAVSRKPAVLPERHQSLKGRGLKALVQVVIDISNHLWQSVIGDIGDSSVLFSFSLGEHKKKYKLPPFSSECCSTRSELQHGVFYLSWLSPWFANKTACVQFTQQMDF